MSGRRHTLPRDELELLKKHSNGTFETFSEEFIVRFKDRYPILKLGKHITNMFYRRGNLLERLDAENKTVLVPRTITRASDHSADKRNNFVDIDAIIVELKNNSEIEKQILYDMLAELKIQTNILKKQQALFELLAGKKGDVQNETVHSQHS